MIRVSGGVRLKGGGTQKYCFQTVPIEVTVFPPPLPLFPLGGINAAALKTSGMPDVLPLSANIGAVGQRTGPAANPLGTLVAGGGAISMMSIVPFRVDALPNAAQDYVI